MAFQVNLKISRQKLEFIYSVFILVIVPVIVVINSIWLTQRVRENFDTELRRKAQLANVVLGTAIQDRLDDEVYISQTAENILNNADAVDGIAIYKVSDNEYQTVYENTHSSRDKSLINDHINFVISKQQPIANLGETDEGNRAWSISTPIVSDGEVVAVTNMDVSLKGADALISDMLQRSLFALMAVVTVIVLLLLNHFKFVQYAMLFKKLKEVDQMKSDFLSVATHELKAPMSVIKGYIENVSDGVIGHVDDEARQALQTAYQETDRLNILISDLLNVSRIEQGKISYNLENVYISEVIQRIVKQYVERAAKKGLKLEYEKPELDYMINADRGRLLEIFTNLIDNAVKYSREGSVKISHKVEEGMIKTTVKDTGIGMSAKEREHLFQRFYRVKNNKTKEIGGTGLGLWIIKQYIEAMKGKIYVDSLEDVGTSFTVEFPLVEEKTPEPEQIQPQDKS